MTDPTPAPATAAAAEPSADEAATQKAMGEFKQVVQGLEDKYEEVEAKLKAAIADVKAFWQHWQFWIGIGAALGVGIVIGIKL